MDSLIRGLHHVTATVTDAQADLDFYVGLLRIGLMVAAAIKPAEVRLWVAKRIHVIFRAAREKSVMKLSSRIRRLYDGRG